MFLSIQFLNRISDRIFTFKLFSSFQKIHPVCGNAFDPRQYIKKK